MGEEKKSTGVLGNASLISNEEESVASYLREKKSAAYKRYFP